MGNAWDGISCEQNENLLTWNCILPQGSFSFEDIQYIGASIYTSRSRRHITTYELNENQLEHTDKSIEQMNVAIPPSEGYNQYIE